MSALVYTAGSGIDFGEVTRTFFRGTNTLTGLTAGHKYLVILSTLNTTGNHRNINGESVDYTGFTDVEMAVRFGDGKYANAGQRCEGAFFVGKATGTTATVGSIQTHLQATVVFDLG